MRAVTDLADQAVILPLCVAVVATLLWLGWRRAALAWVGVVGGTLLLMLCLKLGFAACGPGPGHPGLVDPSGHTASAAVVYGGGIGLLVRRAVPRGVHWWRAGWWQAGLGAALAATLIGTTRVALDMHTVSDVMAGGALGVAGAMLLARLAGPPPLPPTRRRLLLTPLIAVPLLLHGLHLNAEPRIHSLADFWPLSACRAGGA